MRVQNMNIVCCKMIQTVNRKEFTTEDDIQLPNSGFEDWYTDSDGLPKPAKDASLVLGLWKCQLFW